VSREIKFRAWLPDIRKMTYTHTLEELIGWAPNEGLKDTAVWLQYTGIKDKNGMEVYDGDILGINCQFAVDDFDSFLSRVLRNEDLGAWALTGRGGLLCSIRDDWTQAEVLGNIYENPELLGSDEA